MSDDTAGRTDQPDALDAGGRTAARTSPSVHLERIGRYESGQFREDAAEIVAHAPGTDRLFVVNAEAGGVDVLDAADPSNPVRKTTLLTGEAWAEGGEVTNVALADGLLAVATVHETPQEPGRVLFYRADDLELRGDAEVGAGPDMVKFDATGDRAFVACAAEPDAAWERNPEGGIGIVDLSDGAGSATVTFVDFTAFDGREDELRERGVRIFGPGDPSASTNLQPEYLTLSGDESTAYAVLQPNNAIAVVDVEAATVEDLRPLGFKDHSAPGNELDTSDEAGLMIRNWPVRGMYQPDAVDRIQGPDGEEYLLTANEGAMRNDGEYDETARVGELELDPDAFDLDGLAGMDSVEELQRPENLGRLKVTTELGTGEDGRYGALYSFGGRSFAVWTTDGELVFDSGADFELLTAMHHPANFNTDGTRNVQSDRSAAKGPEPEGVVVGEVDDRTYAFVGLERIGSVVVYDVTDPRSPAFVQYVNARDFDVDPESEIGDGPRDAGEAGDLGPEGITFVPADEGPIDDPLVTVANELSGTTTLYRVRSVGEGA
jgi:hypothetical protein